MRIELCRRYRSRNEQGLTYNHGTCHHNVRNAKTAIKQRNKTSNFVIGSCARLNALVSTSQEHTYTYEHIIHAQGVRSWQVSFLSLPRKHAHFRRHQLQLSPPPPHLFFGRHPATFVADHNSTALCCFSLLLVIVVGVAFIQAIVLLCRLW